MIATISIGVLAKQTGCTVPTIRYYEEIGLLPAGPRTETGRRLYREPAVKRLTFIRRCRDFGFSIDQVRELVGLVDEPQRPCVEVRDIASNHLAEVRKKLAELQALESSLSVFVISCDTACAGGPAVDCTILEDLAHRAYAAPLVTASPCCGPPLQNRVLASEWRRICISAKHSDDIKWARQMAAARKFGVRPGRAGIF